MVEYSDMKQTLHLKCLVMIILSIYIQLDDHYCWHISNDLSSYFNRETMISFNKF